MKFFDYLKDKLYAIVLFFCFYFILLLLYFAFKLSFDLIFVASILFVSFFGLLFFIDFFRKKSFYQKLLLQIDQLDQSYLVLELLEQPHFYEGELLYQALYDINKSMIENVKSFELQMNDFKEYVEMWIHEVKIPISSFLLIAHNHKDEIPIRAIESVRKIEDYVEQVLYYVRSENAHKDYFINEVSLQKVISNVALKNKDDFLEHQIDFIVDVQKESVMTDSKWLYFILNQVVHNSIKYKDDSKSSYIKITVLEENETIVLEVLDNGIGIPSSDLKKVFEKSFTGYNGRMKARSTGMGLFIVKNLCEKLGHTISIDSKQGVYTKVSIAFFQNRYYDVLK